MHKFVLSFLLVLSTSSYAEEPEIDFVSPYDHRKNAVMQDLDACEIIGAQRLMRISAYTVAELKQQMKDLEHFFEETKQNRSKCYATALGNLNNLVQEGYAYLSKDERNTVFARQQEIDESLKDIVMLRHRINDQLLTATFQDITLAVKSSTDEEDASSSFYEESSRTRNLVRQDISLVMESLRRQMVLDELKLMNEDNLVLPEFAPHKLNEVYFYLSHALNAFEEAYSHDHPAFVIARIKAKVSFATELYNELVTFMVPLKEHAPKDIKRVSRLYNDARSIKTDIERTLNDLNSGIYGGNLEHWLSVIYKNLNTLANETRDTYAHYMMIRHKWRAAKAQKLYEEEQRAVELSREIQLIPVSITEVTQQAAEETISTTQPYGGKEVPIIAVIPEVESEDLLQKPEVTEPEAAQEKEKKRLTPEASYTELLKRKLSEERKKSRE